MQTSLRIISRQAAKDKKSRIKGLYSRLTESNLLWCFSKINKKASVGEDQLDYKTYSQGLVERIRSLVERLKRKAYKARFVLRKYIPKPGGKQRPLGLISIEDKVVQYGASKMLEAIYEEHFHSFNYGYRPHCSAQGAREYLYEKLLRGKYRWVLDCDLKSYFDTIDHETLIRLLEYRIHDRAFIRLIRKWLKAKIMETDGSILHPYSGTPQGGVISAVLANIYLHYAVDSWYVNRYRPQPRMGEAMLVRYADDFVCAFQYKRDADAFLAQLRERLNQFKLILSEEKTRLIPFSRYAKPYASSFTFLGFIFFWGQHRTKHYPVLKTCTSPKKQRASIEAFADWIRKNRCAIELREIMEKVRQKYHGYWNYFGIKGNSEQINSYYYHTKRLLFKWLNRRSQRKRITWNIFNKMLKQFQIPPPRIKRIEAVQQELPLQVKKKNYLSSPVRK